MPTMKDLLLLSLVILATGTPSSHAAFVTQPHQQLLPTTSTITTITSRAATTVKHPSFLRITTPLTTTTTLFNAAASSSPSTDEPYRIIISGAPASGKGTQCELIKKNYGVIHLSTGDMLRAAVAEGTDVGKLAKEYMDSGKLVPDEVIIGVVSDRLQQTDCLTQGWLLDGFPRTRAQADALAAAGVSADCFLFLNVPDEMLVERVVGRRMDPETGKIYHLKFSPPPADDEELLKRLVHRSDDTEEKVKVRLEQFHANVESVKGCYEDIAVEVDGTMAVEVVAGKIKEALEKCRVAA